MKKIPLLLTLVILVQFVHAQNTFDLKADSVLISNFSKPAELNLENSTKHVKGFLYNKGNGRTEFRKVIKLNDSTFVFGGDTLVMAAASAVDNGLSNSGGRVQLGQSVGAAGNPAVLTDNREIPMNGFDIRFKDIGKGNQGTIKFIADSAKPRKLEWIDFLTTKGDTAGIINLTPQYDVLIGYRAGGETLSATQGANTFIGRLAGTHVTTGFSNTGVGNSSLYSVTTGESNVAMGGLNNLTTGNNNIGIGFTAGAGIRTGNSNIAIGGGSAALAPMQTMQVGNNNIGIGDGTLGTSVSPTIGFSNNVAIGVGAIQQQLPGNSNVGIGYRSGFSTRFGSNNVSVGASTLSNGTVIGDSNVVVGTGITNTSFGSNNVLLGSNINVTGNISNSVIIGKGITNSKSNVVRLGRQDQHVIIGATGDIADNGNQVQINGTASVSDTLKLTNLQAKPASTDYKPLVADAGGNVFKADWPGASTKQTFAQTATATVTSNIETTLMAAGTGSLTIPGGSWVVGKSYKIVVRGVYSTAPANPANYVFKIKLGSTVIAQTASVFVGSSKTNVPFELRAELTCRATGASGSVFTMGTVYTADGSTDNINNGITAATVDLSTDQTLDITVKLSDSTTGNGISAFIVLFEAIN